MLVKIKFQSAKAVFTKTIKGKDGVEKLMKESVDRVNGDNPRPDNMMISDKDCGNPFGTTENLIHYEQVSNILAALLGERPVSTLHSKLWKRIPMLDEIAKNALVKLSNVYFVESDTGKKYHGEKTKMRKSGPSNSKMNETVSWRRYRYRFIDEPEKMDKVSECFEKHLSKPFDENHYISIDEALSEIKGNGEYEEFQKEMVGMKLSGFFSKTNFRPGNPTRLCYFSASAYVATTLSISGEFVMDVPDEIYRRLITGKKTATYLDGGLATLEKWDEGAYGIGYDDFYSEDEYERISEIDKRK